MRTLIAELIGTAITYWLAGLWRLGAVIIFSGFVLLTLLDGLQVVGLVVAGVVVNAKTPPEEDAEANEKWMRRGTYIRLASFLITLGLLWFLYSRLW